MKIFLLLIICIFFIFGCDDTSSNKKELFMIVAVAEDQKFERKIKYFIEEFEKAIEVGFNIEFEIKN